MSIRKPGWPTSWPGSPSIRPTGLMNSCRGIGGRVRRREVRRRDRGGHRSRLHHRLRRQHARRGRRLALRAVDRHVPGRRLPSRLRRRRGRRDRLHQGRHRVPAAEAALAELDAFEAKWDKRYPAIGQAWRRAWEHVIPFFAFPPAIRKIIYTTNAVESLNRSLRKIIKTRGSFPTD